MKNAKDRKAENKKTTQLELRIEPSSNADNDRQNKGHNARMESLGPNTKRWG